jgi:hypothetical protein
MASKVLGGNLHCKDVARAGGLQARTLKDYELEVAKGLGWDGTTVTPVEFIYELLSQLLSQQSIPNDLLPQLFTNSAQISTQLVLGVCVCVQVYVYISAHFYKCVCLGLN